VFIDGDEPKNNKWWDKAKQYIQVKHREPEREINGKPIPTFGALANILRAQILNESPGIYTDIDSLFVKSFNDLLKQDTTIFPMFVKPKEELPGFDAVEVKNNNKSCQIMLGNGCILASNNKFISKWLSYKKEATEPKWGSSGQKIISKLYKYNQELVTPKKLDCFNFETWTETGKAGLYEQNLEFEHDGYMLDLCQAATYDSHLKKLNEYNIYEYNSTYNIQARRFLDRPKLDLTAIVPVCIDSQDRIENVLAITKYMHEQLYIDHIILVETGDTPKLLHMIHHFVPKDVLRYIFVQTYNDEPWSRSITFNTALHYVKTPIVAVWDTDILIPLSSLKISNDYILNNKADIIIPWETFYHVKRRVLNDVKAGQLDYNKLINNKDNILSQFKSVGAGCTIMSAAVMRHVRGFSELFKGWGNEDDEIVFRLQNLGFRVMQASKCPLIHISHERTANSKVNPDYYDLTLAERARIIEMNKADLCEYYGITEKVCDYVKQEKPRPGETVTKRDSPVTIPDPQY
jgi:hypothetical protein